MALKPRFLGFFAALSKVRGKLHGVNNALPNFLIVGAAKSGTTSLYYYLNQHPEIFMSKIKEPLFFCSHGTTEAHLVKEFYPVGIDNLVRDFADYQALFCGAEQFKAVGEASVYYLPDHAKTIRNIQQFLPAWRELKIVIILRNPVEASFSHHQMYSQYIKHFLRDAELPPYAQSLCLEEARLAAGNRALAHFHWFRYFEQVKAYRETFANVKIFLYDDLRADATAVVRELFEYLGVDSNFVPSSTGETYNASGVPKSGLMYRFLVGQSWPKKLVGQALRMAISQKRKERLVNWLFTRNLEKAEMGGATRAEVLEYYRTDIDKLEGLIGRDLSAWRT